MKTILAALALSGGLLSAPASANLFYGFDTDVQGWTAIDGGDLLYRPTGGNLGGYLQTSDVSDADMRVVAPPSALGDWSAYLGGRLSFDALNGNGESPDWAPFGTIVITGAAGSVTLDIAADNQPPADGAWHRYSVALDAATWGANLPSVLGQVTGVTIETEFHAGVTEVAGFDNFAVTAVPEPGTYALMLAGLVGLGLGLRRRH